LRQNPQRYEETAGTYGLKQTFASIANNEEKPNYMLWSEKAYDKLNDYFCLADMGSNIDLNSNDALNMLVHEDNKEKFNCSVFYLVGGFKKEEEAIWAMLKKNQTSARRILTENFDIACVCAVSCDNENDRVALVLANKVDA